jgi:hypothetical protein
MREQNCPNDRLPSSIPVIALPVALYISDDLIFELYNGGQPHRQFVIRWERLRHRAPARVQGGTRKHGHPVYERV